MTKILLETPEAMFALGETLAKEYPILFVEWELWAWKTTLIKWFAQWLGIDATTVTSPTYTYIQEYNNKLLHIDMYNVTSFDELVQKGIVALIHEYDRIVIERPKFVDQLGVNWLSVSIEKLGWDKRKVYLQ